MTSDRQKEQIKQWAKEHPEAMTAHKKAYRAANAARITEMRRARRALDPEKNRAAARAWRQKNPGRALETSRIKKYGITPEMFADYFDAQEGACAFCGRPLPAATNRIAVDHDHRTGTYRGLVHGTCNTVIGHAERDDNFAGYIANTEWRVA